MYPFSVWYVCKLDSSAHILGAFSLALKSGVAHYQCEHLTPPEAPSCALWVPTIAGLPTPFYGSAFAASPNILAVLPLQLPHTAVWYTKTRLYHILR
jgi:hypothetical protein